MRDFLGAMAVSSRRRLHEAMRQMPESELRRHLRDLPATRGPARDASRFDVIAELKPRAPGAVGSWGHGAPSPTERAAGYESAGACAISVITEPTVFGGSLALLSEAARGSGLPLIRKDFLVDPYQVLEARVHGASGVLLIARLVDPAVLGEMVAAAVALNLFVLVEAFGTDDLPQAIAAVAAAGDAGSLGVNARDLETLAIERDRHRALAPHLPQHVRKTAESGLATPADAAAVAGWGYDTALVGTALMRLGDPAPLLAAMIHAGRKVAAQREVMR